jgi:hypothetical protein
LRGEPPEPGAFVLAVPPNARLRPRRSEAARLDGPLLVSSDDIDELDVVGEQLLEAVAGGDPDPEHMGAPGDERGNDEAELITGEGI